MKLKIAGVEGVGAGGGGAGAGEERGGGLVEEQRADAELEQEELARGRGRGGGGGGGRGGAEEGVPGGGRREVLRDGGVRAVAEPRAPRAARLQPPRQLVAAPVLAQQLRRRHPACARAGGAPGGISWVVAGR